MSRFIRRTGQAPVRPIRTVRKSAIDVPPAALALMNHGSAVPAYCEGEVMINRKIRRAEAADRRRAAKARVEGVE